MASSFFRHKEEGIKTKKFWNGGPKLLLILILTNEYLVTFIEVVFDFHIVRFSGCWMSICAWISSSFELVFRSEIQVYLTPNKGWKCENSTPEHFFFSIFNLKHDMLDIRVYFEVVLESYITIILGSLNVWMYVHTTHLTWSLSYIWVWMK